MAGQNVIEEQGMGTKKVSRNAQRLLTVREILNARDGVYSDGGGLYLRVTGASAVWFFRYTAASGKRREMGLGPVSRRDAESASDSVTTARDDADAARKVLAAGLDPIDVRSAAEGAKRAGIAAKKAESKAAKLTLARASRAYHEKFVEPHRTEKHAFAWLSSLERNVPEALWHRPIAEVTAGDLLDFLLDLHETIAETAGRIRQRLEAVFDDAMLRGHVPTNPAAAIRRKLTTLAKRKKVEHFRSLPHEDVPAFVESLRAQPGDAAIALQLLLLTASRTSEVLLATKGEFDVDARMWKIDGRRMKGGEDHVVYLSERAASLVKVQIDDKSNVTDWLFPSPTGTGKPLSNMAMLVLLKRMKLDKITTAHGLRATFSTWANESGRYRSDVIEACLAHQETNKIRAAYNRAQFAAERRALLEDWSAYCTETEIVELKTAA